MKWYIGKRLLMLIPVLLGASLIAFSVMHLAPGDPAHMMAGKHVSEETLQKIREKYGLDKPLMTQYFIWLGKVFQGNLGRSIISNDSVTDEIMARFPNTVELTIFAMLFAVFFGTLAGIFSATKQYSLFDYSSMSIALFGISIPVFWLGIMLMMVFGVYLRWLPISGRISQLIPFQSITGFYILDSVISGNFAALMSSLRHLILPSITLGTIPMALIARMTRSSMLEVLRQDFIRTERAKGLPESMVIYKHALRNALMPIVTVIGLSFGQLLAGAILTETVFSWPGVGRYVLMSIYMRDYPSVQGCVLFFAFIFVMLNLITDIVYIYIDPRIHYQ